MNFPSVNQKFTIKFINYLLTFDNRVVTMTGKLIAFRVDEETYKKLESLGKPSQEAKKILIDYFDKEKEREEKLFEIEQKLSIAIVEMDKIARRQELIEGILRKRGLWR
jgi:predicted DNA-binding ribbon-helix-helix protein